jgi:hypothetical protein
MQDNREQRAFGAGKSYQFMMRTRQPGGVVTNQLYLVMDELADLVRRHAGVAVPCKSTYVVSSVHCLGVKLSIASYLWLSAHSCIRPACLPWTSMQARVTTACRPAGQSSEWQGVALGSLACGRHSICAVWQNWHASFCHIFGARLCSVGGVRKSCQRPCAPQPPFLTARQQLAAKLPLPARGALASSTSNCAQLPGIWQHGAHCYSPSCWAWPSCFILC